MASMWVKVEACICNCTEKLCGSLRNAAFILGVILGSVSLVAEGASNRIVLELRTDEDFWSPFSQPQRGYGFMSLVVTRALHLLFFGCLALVWGICIARVELLLGYLAAAAIVVPTCIVGAISWFFSYYYRDEKFFALSIIFAVVLPLHMVIVHGLIQEMKGVKTPSPPKDEWVQPNLTVSAQEKIMEKENPVELPAVFSPENSTQIT